MYAKSGKRQWYRVRKMLMVWRTELEHHGCTTGNTEVLTSSQGTHGAHLVKSRQPFECPTELQRRPAAVVAS
jgi:hypothetical protein